MNLVSRYDIGGIVRRPRKTTVRVAKAIDDRIKLHAKDLCSLFQFSIRLLNKFGNPLRDDGPAGTVVLGV